MGFGQRTQQVELDLSYATSRKKHTQLVYFFTLFGGDKLSSTCCEEPFAKEKDKG